MFKEWFFRFIGHIITVIILIAVMGLCASVIGFIVWIGRKSLILGISTIVVLGLIGLGTYTFYEIKNEK